MCRSTLGDGSEEDGSSLFLRQGFTGGGFGVRAALSCSSVVVCPTDQTGALIAILLCEICEGLEEF
jgi:hypothetical protein